MGLFNVLKATYKLSKNGSQLLNNGLTELNNGLENINSELEHWNEDLREKKPLSELKHKLWRVEIDLTYAKKSLSQNETTLDKYLSLFLDAVSIGKQYIQFGIDHQQYRRTILKVIEQAHCQAFGIDFSTIAIDIEQFCKKIKEDPTSEESEAKDDLEQGGFEQLKQQLNQTIDVLNRTVPVKLSLQSVD